MSTIGMRAYLCLLFWNFNWNYTWMISDLVRTRWRFWVFKLICFTSLRIHKVCREIYFFLNVQSNRVRNLTTGRNICVNRVITVQSIVYNKPRSVRKQSVWARTDSSQSSPNLCNISQFYEKIKIKNNKVIKKCKIILQHHLVINWMIPGSNPHYLRK